MLLCKIMIINGRRISISLKKETWKALKDICRWEHIKLNELCSEIDRQKRKARLISKMRKFSLRYFRNIVCEQKEKENISPWNYR